MHEKKVETIEFDISNISPSKRYSMLISLVVPRPIAFVTTIDENGIVNAAPFSFFNLMGNDPPVLAIGIGKDQSRKNGLKDSAYNIQTTKEFVVNVVNEKIIEKVNLAAAEFPSEVDETEIAGLTKLPSVKVKPPRIAECAAHLESRLLNCIEIGNNVIVLGEIVYLHVNKEFVNLQNGNNIFTERISPVGRMHNRDVYTRTRELFKLPRITYKEWLAKYR